MKEIWIFLIFGSPSPGLTILGSLTLLWFYREGEVSSLRIHYSEPEIFLWWRVSALRIFPFLSFLKFRERVNGELRVDLQNVALPWIPLGNLCWAHFLTGCQQVSECGWVSRGGREEGDRTGSSFNLKNYFFYFHIFWVYRYICAYLYIYVYIVV